MCCAQLPAELNNQAYVASDIAHRMKLITKGMDDSANAAGNCMAKFPPINVLLKKLADAKQEGDRARIKHTIEHKLGELGVEVGDVNMMRKNIARECLERSIGIERDARKMNTYGWARPPRVPVVAGRDPVRGIDWYAA